MKKADYQRLIEWALDEDLSDRGDITSESILSDEKCSAVLMSKDTGILAGMDIFKDTFLYVDGRLDIKIHCRDGDELVRGQKIAHIYGSAVSILKAERTALNFLSYISGIATKTRQFAAEARKHGRVQILDTRKTLPGYREIAKYAVKTGGGNNHRMGLFDQVLIKENHIDNAGSVTSALEKVRNKWNNRFMVEIECRNIKEVRESLPLQPDIIMLDNFTVDEVREAVKIIDHKSKIELSGNMDLEKITEYSRLDVDFISSGALTHSVRAFDFTLLVEMEG